MLSKIRDHLMDDRLTSDDVDELYRLEATLKSEPRLADQHIRAAEWVEKVNHRRADQQAKEIGSRSLSAVHQAAR